MMKRALLLLLLTGVGACAKKAEPVRRTEPWLANPSASSAVGRSAPQRFHFSSESVVHFTLPTRKGKPGGTIPVRGGELMLDSRQLERSRASLDVDLTQLAFDETTLPPGAELGGGSARSAALDWLELGNQVPREKRDQFTTARFELVSVESSSAPDLGAEPRSKRVRATVVGTLLLHGFRAPLRAEVWLERLGEGTDPARLSIRSAAPLVIPFGPHDITARSPSGVVDPLAAARALEWVGKSVRLEVELIAESAASPATPSNH